MTVSTISSSKDVNIMNWKFVEVESCFKPIEQLMHNIVYIQMMTAHEIYICRCWCCLVEHVYHYHDWQNDQHAIKYDIVRQAHSKFRLTSVQQVYSNRRTKSSFTGYNEVTKMN